MLRKITNNVNSEKQLHENETEGNMVAEHFPIHYVFFWLLSISCNIVYIVLFPNLKKKEINEGNKNRKQTNTRASKFTKIRSRTKQIKIGKRLISKNSLVLLVTKKKL